MCIDWDYAGDALGQWDEEHCLCNCPSGFRWKNGWGCELIECDDSDRQDCETGGHKNYDWLPGTWNYNTCACDCPQGTQFVELEGCVKGCFDPNDPAYAQDMDWCEAGGKVQDHVPGIWNPTTCECMCLRGSEPVAPGVCQLKQGWDEQDFYQENDDCFGGNESDCSWQDEIWDAYDEGLYDDQYGDQYDDYWDYDYDYDYW